MSKSENLPPLTPRATELVEYLVRYVLIVPPILERMYPELSQEALRKYLERLAEDGWIVRHQLPGEEGYYWMLSARACNRIGLKRRASAFRQGPLIRNCLTALFFASQRHLRLLTSTECRDSLPDIYRRGSSSQYFLDLESTDTVRLGWLVVDDGKKPLRIFNKLKEIAAIKKANPALYQLCLNGAFRFAVATTAAPKADKIRKLLDERPLRDIPVDVVPVEEAMSLALLTRKGG